MINNRNYFFLSLFAFKPLIYLISPQINVIATAARKVSAVSRNQFVLSDFFLPDGFSNEIIFANKFLSKHRLNFVGALTGLKSGRSTEEILSKWSHNC